MAASQAAIFEEELLRVSGELTGHRYLFGLLAMGGLRCDLDDAACGKALGQSREVLKQLTALERQLRLTSSFLDRLEEVGAITQLNATVYGLAGPVRGLPGSRDLRKTQPYGGYETYEFEVPSGEEGDGYARLRILFEEARNRCASWSRPAQKLKVARFSGTQSAGRRGSRLGRSAAWRGFSLGADRWKGPRRSLAHDVAFFPELARVPPSGGEFRLPGFSNHPGDDGSVRRGKRSLMRMPELHK